jgi:Asp-tRNA(Asn)/Glu-tRNA(Gln) amidotransferase A subunit family amidase
MLQVIAGYDPADTCSADQPLSDLTAHIAQFPQALKIGVPRRYFFHDLDPEVSASVEQAIDVFRRLHADVRDIDLEVSVDRTLSSAESWAFHEPMVVKTPELYNPITLARIQSGAKTSAASVLFARRELESMRRRISETFEQVDVLLTPTIPILPPKIDALNAHPDQLRPAELLMLRNTRPFNVWGIPAISVPCGTTKAGLSIGLQLASPAWREDLLLQAAFAFEQAQQ